MSVTRGRVGLALAGAVLTLGATTALADSTFVPAPATGTQFLRCTDTASPAGKVDIGTARFAEGPAPASVTTGAGCGKPDEPVFSGTIQETAYTFALAGNVKGNLDTLTVALHTIDAGPSRAPGAPVTLAVRATVGGKSLFGFTERTSVAGDVVASPQERKVTITPTPTGSTGQVRALTFTIEGIDFLTEADLAKKSGHEVVIDVRDVTPNAAVSASNVNAWVWGAAEAPSSVTLSPAEKAAAVMTADARSTRK